MTGPLAGLKVLDFTHVLAGPFATRLMGDMGADVVKVNSSVRAGPMENINPHFLMWNRNKRALAIDMTRDEARPYCLRLCQQADVVIDNFSLGVLDRWGVGYDTVSKSNPGVVYVQMSGMGDGGPWSKFVTYAPTIHALGGLTYLTGVPDHNDIGIGYSYNDPQAGLHAVVAVLAAVEHRRQSGKGQRVDMSQFEVGVNFLGPTLMDYFANGNVAEPTGNGMPYDLVAPHNCYRCAGHASKKVADERWIAIACMNEGQWQSLCEVMDNPDWCQDEAFATAKGRVANVERLDAGIAAWTSQFNVLKVMHLCQRAGVPAGLVQNGLDLVARDPQLAANGFIRTTSDEHPDFGVMNIDALPLQFQGTPCTEYRRVRKIGEDNVSVLRDWLGMTESEVQSGEDAGILV